MKLIPLTQGKFAQVDDEDFEELNKYKWFAFQDGHNCYARRNVYLPNGKRSNVSMHREIMKCKRNDGILIDHEDRHGLNCQKYNLRKSTKAQNNSNRRSSKNGTSKYLGVHLCKESSKWKATIKSNKKVITIGRFFSESEAAIAYNKKAKELHGEYANLNIINA